MSLLKRMWEAEWQACFAVRQQTKLLSIRIAGHVASNSFTEVSEFLQQGSILTYAYDNSVVSIWSYRLFRENMEQYTHKTPHRRSLRHFGPHTMKPLG